MDTSNITGIILGFMSGWIFWFILGAVLILATAFILIVKKQRRLSVMVVEVMRIGQGKVNLLTKSKHPLFRGKLKGGWFKEKTRFLGLVDYGTFDLFKTNDGRIVREVSTKDYHELNGRSCLIVARSPENPSILVPLDRLEIENEHILSSIAPADFTGASVQIFEDAVKEAGNTTWKEIVVYALLALVVIGAIIGFVMISQTQKATTLEATKQIESARVACSPDVLANACVNIFQNLQESSKFGGSQGSISTAP